MKKPDATTVISPADFRRKVWPLPAEELLGVGRATQMRLRKQGVFTIGQLANTQPNLLESWFGKWGLFLCCYANGLDSSPVRQQEFEAAVKSVGNSTTCPRDLQNERDCHIVFQNLSESVAERMRDLGLMAQTVSIALRTNDLEWCTRQARLSKPSMISTELTDGAMKLLRAHYKWEKPLRGIGIKGSNLLPIGGERQLSLLEDDARREKLEQLEYAIDGIRRRFGHRAIGRALLQMDERLGKLNPKADHIIHPVGFL